MSKKARFAAAGESILDFKRWNLNEVSNNARLFRG